MNALHDAPRVVWHFRDGKPGHDRQGAGLLKALARRQALDVHTLDVREHAFSWWQCARRRLPESLAPLPDPTLIVGAGHACELALLTTTRARGGRSVYLMKPSLPRACFDLCLVPQHDGVAPGPRVELTLGVLNDVEPAAGPRDGPVLILVGGPSAHHDWDEAGLLKQLASLVFGSRERHFAISDSRRTPPSTSARLQEFAQPGVTVHSHRDTSPDWLTTALVRAPDAWVTADSVSMLFEALTAGCAVGMIAVPAKRQDRISDIAPALVREGRISTLSAWRELGCLPRPVLALAEAARCAEIVAARLLAER